MSAKGMSTATRGTAIVELLVSAQTLVRRATSSGHENEIETTDLSSTFGEMVKLAFPVLEIYQSDLWHDAIMLNRYVGKQEAVLYFVVGTSHTWLFEASVLESDESSVYASILGDAVRDGDPIYHINLRVHDERLNQKMLTISRMEVK